MNILGHSFFTLFDTKDAYELSRQAQIITKTSQEIIFAEGEQADGIYLLIQGLIAVSKRDSSGHSSVIAHINEGDFFGEFAVLDGGNRSATVHSVTPVILAKIGRDVLLNQMNKSRVSAEIMKRVIGRFRDTNERRADEQLRQERLHIINKITGNIIENFQNPLTSIYMFAEMVKKKNPELSHYCNIAQEQVDRMSGMADEILDYCNGNTMITKNKCNISRLFERFEVLNQAYLSSKNISLKMKPVKLQINADDEKLLRLFQLISTFVAQYFDESGGTITFTATRDDKHLVITISDNGLGIPESKIKRIFSTGSLSKEQDFDAIDMAIARSIVDAHKGTITVASEPGNGTTFTIRLPR